MLRKKNKNVFKKKSSNRGLSLVGKTVRGNEKLPRSLPFPNIMRCTLTYAERFPLFINNSASAVIYQYCGNDLFDPNFTGTGGQPTYFDQLSLLYNRFRVYASAIEVKAYNTTTAQTTYCDLVLVPVATTAAAFSIQNLQSLPRAKLLTVNVNRPAVLTAKHSTSEVLGVKDVEGADRLQALVTASPAERWLWAIGAQTYDSTTAVTMGIDVRISYSCEFYDRQIQVQSLLTQQHAEKVEQKEEYVEVASKPSPLVLSSTPSSAKIQPKSKSMK